MHRWLTNPTKLQELREEAQLTPEQLASQVGCHFNHYRKLERPLRSPVGAAISTATAEPSDTLAWKIVNVLTKELGRKIRVEDIATPKFDLRDAA